MHIAVIDFQHAKDFLKYLSIVWCLSMSGRFNLRMAFVVLIAKSVISGIKNRIIQTISDIQASLTRK